MSGHNSVDQKLLSLVQRYERLDEEIGGLKGDQKDLMTEAKSGGYTPKLIRRLIKERNMTPEDIANKETEEVLLNVYRRGLGQMADLPLGVAAMERAGA